MRTSICTPLCIALPCLKRRLTLVLANVQEKEQALMSISDNAKRHIERSRADRARTYDTLLKQYRHENSSLSLATFNMANLQPSSCP